MRIVLLGSGYAVPSKERVQSGILVSTEENLILLDCGSGVLGNLARLGYSATDITHVCFTHHHVDHDADFLPILKTRLLLEKTDLNVCGPLGTGEWIDALFKAYPYLEGKTELEIHELKDGDTVDLGHDRVTCAHSCHLPNSIAYRLDSDSSVVYSGDSEPCEGIKTLIGNGVDVLIHECSLLEPSPDISGHSTPQSLGKMLDGAPVKKLVLTHLPPEISKREEEVLEILKRHFQGEIVIGTDLLSMKVP